MLFNKGQLLREDIVFLKKIRELNWHTIHGKTKNINTVRANYLEGTIKTVWIGPMAQSEHITHFEDVTQSKDITQSENIIQSEDGQIKL